jgi:methylated-DNA-[protein]-cysteine S-methyltransferase
MRNNPIRKSYFFKSIDSPVGQLQLVASGDGLAAILWENDPPNRVRLEALAEDRNHPVLLEAEKQLGEYFAGQRTSFDLQLDFAGTEFQRKVWTALLEIPFGETRTYGQIARQLGNPNAMRAVGAANGRNPISIVAPCHRVIGADGGLIGFAGGLKVKEYLLAKERGTR